MLLGMAGQIANLPEHCWVLGVSGNLFPKPYRVMGGGLNIARLRLKKRTEASIFLSSA